MNYFIRKISNRVSKKAREKRRIKNIPRYSFGETRLLGLKVDFVDSVSFLNGYAEIFEEACYYFKTDNLCPNIIDCGSNIGLGIVYFKQLYPDSKIIGFEPDPKIFKVLKRNISTSKFKNIELHNKAIWDSNGLIKFRQEGGFSGRIPIKGEKSDFDVECVKLSPYINENIDLLKIDIEGAEIDVLYEIESKLKFVHNIFIEYHSPAGEEQRFDELVKILKENNFRYYIKEAFAPRKPFGKIELLDSMDLQLNVYGINYECLHWNPTL